jgi:hypothetical protein
MKTEAGSQGAKPHPRAYAAPEDEIFHSVLTAMGLEVTSVIGWENHPCQ